MSPRIITGQSPADLLAGSLLVCLVLQSPEDVLWIKGAAARIGPSIAKCICTPLQPPAVADLLSAHGLSADGFLVYGPSLPPWSGIEAATARADIVFVGRGCRVAPGLIGALEEAAYSDTTIATASPLTFHGSFGSVYGSVDPGPSERLGLEEAAEALLERSARLFPRVPAPGLACAYLRRDALELAGGLDPAFESLGGALIDFAARCTLRGLLHVVADQAIVEFVHPEPLEPTDHRLIRKRYPFYHAAAEAAAEEPSRPLLRSLSTARSAVKVGEKVSVTIDGGCLTQAITGAQVHVLEVLGALAERGDVRLRVLLPEDCLEYARRTIAGMPGVETLSIEDRGLPRSEVVHRPWQLRDPVEAAYLRRAGDRLVITQLDLIEFRNPGNFGNFEEWQAGRHIMRGSLWAADAALFISQHARNEAIREGLVNPGRAHVIYPGVERVVVESVSPAEPGFAKGLDDAFILCLGNDFSHKNRLFALGLLEELRVRGRKLRLLLLGPRAMRGDSRKAEDSFLEDHPDLRPWVIRRSVVTDAERAWVLANARLVVYPSTVEGFGLIPFEAAAQGTPCLFAARASLAEVVPAEAAMIVPWDLPATAGNAAALLDDEEIRRRNVELIMQAAAPLTWQATAARLAGVYGSLAARPPRAADWKASLLPVLLGPGGVLPERTQQALLAVASRPSLRRTVFGSLDKLYLLARFLWRLFRRLRN